MNPFKYGQVVSEEDFCPRPGFIRQLAGFMESGQNVVLTGERRIGKTSLICEAVNKTKNRRMIYIDLLEVKTSDDLCRRMIKALLSAEKHSSFFTRMLKGLAGLRPSISIDPVSGQPSVSLDSRVTLNPDSIESILDLFAEMNETGSIVVVFDEFQDILNLKDSGKTLAILRSRIQFHGNIPYFFAGSMRNRMYEIFSDSESPFFKSAAAMEIGPLDNLKFARFLKSKFDEGEREISTELLKRIIDMFDSVSGDIQEFCCALWDRSSRDDRITEKLFEKAFHLVFARESKTYEALLMQVSAQQLKCLSALAKLGGESPYSRRFLSESGIPQPGSVRMALTKLCSKKILFRKAKEYRFANPYFKHWLALKNY